MEGRRPECNGGRTNVYEQWRIFSWRAGDIRSVFRFKRSGHGKRANIERRRGSRIIRTTDDLPREPEIYAAFSVSSEAITENARILNGGKGRRNRKCKYKNNARIDHQRKGISRRVFRFSGAVTENARDRPGLGGHWVVVVSWFMGGNLVGCFRGCILGAGLLGGFWCAEGFSVEGRRRAERGAHRTPPIERAADGHHHTTYYSRDGFWDVC